MTEKKTAIVKSIKPMIVVEKLQHIAICFSWGTPTKNTLNLYKHIMLNEVN
jgi:hypothetical protein